MIPRMIILTYRLIPARVRSLWSLGTSSSHLALASPSWGSIWQYAGAPALRIMLGVGSDGWGRDKPSDTLGYPPGR